MLGVEVEVGLGGVAVVDEHHHAVVVGTADDPPRGLEHAVHARVGVGVGVALPLAASLGIGGDAGLVVVFLL